MTLNQHNRAPRSVLSTISGIIDAISHLQTKEEILEAALHEIAAVSAWEVGHVYLPSIDDPEYLTSSNIWHFSEKGRFETFKEFTEKTEFKSGEGLPGRILECRTGESIPSLEEDTEFRRTKMGADIGLKSGFGFPVIDDGKLIAVIEFFSCQENEASKGLLEVLSEIGKIIGGAITRVEYRRQIDIHEAVLNHNKDAILIFDPHGIIVDCNNAALEAFGYDRAELICMTDIDLAGDPEHWREQRQTMVRSLDEGTNWQEVVLLARCDGQNFTATQTFSACLDEHGDQIGIISTIRDETEQQNSRSTLARQVQILDQMSEGVLVTDTAGQFVDCNPAAEKILGLGRLDLLAKTESDLLSGTDNNASTLRLINRSVRDGKYWIGDIPLETPGNKNGVIKLTVSALSGAQGNWIGNVWTFHDLTIQKDLEAQLGQVQRVEAVGQLAGGLAHDFNNLLSTAIGYITLAKEDAEEISNDDIVRHLKIAEQALWTGTQLATRIMELSGKQQIVAKNLRINDVIDDLSLMLERTLDETIVFECSVADDLWPVSIDISQLESAILNLAINARHAMPGGGHLIIEASNADRETMADQDLEQGETGDWVRILVSDTGTGMPPEVVERIFEPFFTTKAKGEGTGLGLSMIYGFVTQAGGKISVNSTVGTGTAFEILLPRSKEFEVEENSLASRQTRKAGAGEHILVVEDDMDVHSMVVTVLTHFGYQVDSAETAEEALEAIRTSEHFDLLFTDIVLPGGKSGVDLANEVLQIQPDAKFLLTSGYPREELRKLTDVGAKTNILKKPYQPDELLDALSEALAR